MKVLFRRLLERRRWGTNEAVGGQSWWGRDGPNRFRWDSDGVRSEFKNTTGPEIKKILARVGSNVWTML